MNGAHVQSRVEEGNRKGNEDVTIQNLAVVGKIVQETRKIKRTATLSNVDVSISKQFG